MFLNDRLSRVSRRRLLHEIAGQTVIGEHTLYLGQQILIACAGLLQIRLSLLWRFFERRLENLFDPFPAASLSIMRFVPSSIVHSNERASLQPI